MFFQLVPDNVTGILFVHGLGGIFGTWEGHRRHAINPQVPQTQGLLPDYKFRNIRLQSILHGLDCSVPRFCMAQATFFFHGLFPDHAKAGGHGDKPTSKVLFDVEFEGSFHSHLLADLKTAVGEDQELVFEVRHALPFECPEFPQAVVRYYRQVMGPQSTTISPSGPKGPTSGQSVYQVQWEVSLEAHRRVTDPQVSG